MMIELDTLKRPISDKCFVIIIDTDAFKKSDIYPTDRLLINPELKPDDKCDVLLELKPSGRLTLARYRDIGNKTYITIMEDDCPQIEDSELDYEIKGLIIKSWREGRDH